MSKTGKLPPTDPTLSMRPAGDEGRPPLLMLGNPAVGKTALAAELLVIEGQHFSGTDHTAALRDISTHGASFECCAGFIPGRLISFQIGGLAQQLGEVVWSEEVGGDLQGAARIGVQFQLPLTLRDLAAASLKLQPFAPKASAALSDAPREASAACSGLGSRDRRLCLIV